MAFILHDRTGVIYHWDAMAAAGGVAHGFSTRRACVTEEMFP